MNRPSPLLKVDGAEKLASPLIPTPHHLTSESYRRSKSLKPFGITPGTKRDGEATFKGYLLSDFTEAFAAYLPDQTVTPSQPNNDGHCDGVTVSTPRSPASAWI